MHRIRPLLALCLLTLAGCGGAPHAPPPAQPWDDPGFVTEGDWSLYYTAFSAHDLNPDLAKEYAVAANPSGALVVVSLASATHHAVAADASVEMHVSTLTGVERPVHVRRVERNGAVSWLGEFTIARRELLLINVSARADASSPAITAQFRRELYLE